MKFGAGRRGAVRGARTLAGLALATLASTAALAADGVEQLRRFVAATQSAQGEFEQTVIASSGRKPQHAAGNFSFARPGQFRWEYQRPYQQLLVGDGERLWSWDRDLNQVTVQRIGDALGATPAAILFGKDAIDDAFALSEGGASGGLSWVEAQPRRADSGFESVRIGLSDGQLRRMEMRDNFGQSTQIVFTRLQSDPQLDRAQFRFVPPEGADLIGDAGEAVPAAR
ncbi:MAG: outer membrane lipoprotein chaperone LolA [Thauera phenolivorans]|uniref:Outer-membrane lipoprotein carrier protein n=1 Tax=Thauera phenolivorans TaxID=1792543 RepID=A0A7X7R7F8_9RHOO|nr:outer membrane lipoprotein chaperone LolA [Thauera phenolivorans]NLF53248.1 outer membrane lipoprotein chaperone LolA [Thauera phenolivorans]